MRLIQFIVKDKHALQALDAIESFAVEKPGISLAQERIPLPHSATENHAHGVHTGAAEHVDAFITNAKQAKLKKITGKQLVQHMKMGGFSKYSYGYRLNQLLKDKALKRTRQSGVYEVC